MKHRNLLLIALTLFLVDFSTASITVELSDTPDKGPLLTDDEITQYKKYLADKQAFQPIQYCTWELSFAPDGLRALFKVNEEQLSHETPIDKLNLKLTLSRIRSQEIERLHPHTYKSVKLRLVDDNLEYHCTQSMIRRDLRKDKKKSCLIL